MSENVWVPDTREQFGQEKLRIISAVLNKIPALSLSVRRIIEMAGDKNVDSRELVEVASADPVLASKILMMVNSSYYGLNRKIDNLRLAIVLLGFNEVRDIAIQLGFLQVVGKSEFKSMYDPKGLWTHSYLVSVCAETFSGDDDPKREGVLMTMGIMHDIGKFALSAIGEMMEKKGVKSGAGKDVNPDIPNLANEQNIFGVNHNIIGAMLVEKWNLSERASDVIEFHHHPSYFSKDSINSDFIEDIAIICISDSIVNRISGVNKYLREPAPFCFEVLGINPSLEDIITPELETKIEKAREQANFLS